MKAGRIAIWNKNKVVAAIALGMVVTNFAFFVQGKCGGFPLHCIQVIENLTQTWL